MTSRAPDRGLFSTFYGIPLKHAKPGPHVKNVFDKGDSSRYVQRICLFCHPSMADVDSVLLEVINTKHKKNAGTLRLLTSKLIWIPQGHDEPKLSTFYSEIKGRVFSFTVETQLTR